MDLNGSAVSMIPLEKLAESPFNRRRTWGNLDELAASIASVGVLEYVAGKPAGDLLERVRAKGKLETKTVMIGKDGKPVEIVDKKELIKAAGVKEPGARGADPIDWKKRQEEEQRERKVEEAAENAIKAAIVEKVEAKGEIPVALLRMLCVDALGYNSRFLAWRRGWAKASSFNAKIEPHLAELGETQLLGVLVEAVLDDHLEDACGLLGVDHKTIRKATRDQAKAAAKTAEEAKAKAPAKPAAKPAKKGGKKS